MTLNRWRSKQRNGWLSTRVCNEACVSSDGSSSLVHAGLDGFHHHVIWSPTVAHENRAQFEREYLGGNCIFDLKNNLTDSVCSPRRDNYHPLLYHSGYQGSQKGWDLTSGDLPFNARRSSFQKLSLLTELFVHETIQRAFQTQDAMCASGP
jgi:hypothetical protein